MQEEIDSARKPVAHLVIHRNSMVKYLTPWENIFDAFPEYDSNVIYGDDEFETESFWIQDTSYKSSQLRKITELIRTGGIGNGDIICFTDAWNTSIIPLRYMIREFKLDVRVIGFWADNGFERMFNSAWLKFYEQGQLSHLGFAKMYEVALLFAIDYNCIANKTLASKMQWRFYPMINTKPVFHCGLPFGFMREQFDQIDYSRKRNIILFPFEPLGEKLELFEAIFKNHKDWQVIMPADKKVNREEYLELLDIAKVVVVTEQSSLNQVSLYETMCHGCYPLIPKRFDLKRYFGEDFRYDDKKMKNAKTFLELFRARESLQNQIEWIFSNYEEACFRIKERVDLLNHDFYNNDIFEKIVRSKNPNDIVEIEFLHEGKESYRNYLRNKKKKTAKDPKAPLLNSYIKKK